jgi:hypothetical protein
MYDWRRPGSGSAAITPVPSSQDTPQFNLSSIWTGHGLGTSAENAASQDRGNYGQIAKYGVYGQGGIDQMMNGLPGEMAARRKALMARIQARLASRLGNRAGGAAEVMAANQIYAPQYAEDIATRRSLMRENFQSKLSGLQGMSDATRALMSKYGIDVQGDASKPGFLDWVKAAGSIAGSVTGGK